MSVFVWAGPIDNEFLTAFCNYRYNSDRNCARPPAMMLKTPGGDAGAFLAAHDIMRADGNWEVTAMGDVSSCGTLLIASGAHRRAMPNTRLMLHNALIDVPTDLNAKELSIYLEELQLWDCQLYSLLARYTRTENSTWRARLAQGDRFYSALEAKDLGLIDEIL